jgi:trehalose synthase
VLPVVPVHPRRLTDDAAAAGEEALDRLRAAAEPFRGSRPLLVNGTPFGGGVAELLHAHVPRLHDLRPPAGVA